LPTSELNPAVPNRFLLGPTAAELKALASEGPIVFVNASTFGYYAFIVTESDLKILPLKMFGDIAPGWLVDSKDTSIEGEVHEHGGVIKVVANFQAWVRNITRNVERKQNLTLKG